MPIAVLPLLRKRIQSKGPSLPRRYPASTVLRPFPTSDRTDPLKNRSRRASTDRVSPVARFSLPTCRSHYPGGSDRLSVDAYPARAAFPDCLAGRHPHLRLSRPARALLTLRPAGSLNRPRRPLSRGFNPEDCSPKPLVSYRTHRHLSGWNLPPLEKRTLQDAQAIHGAAMPRLETTSLRAPRDGWLRRFAPRNDEVTLAVGLNAATSVTEKGRSHSGCGQRPRLHQAQAGNLLRLRFPILRYCCRCCSRQTIRRGCRRPRRARSRPRRARGGIRAAVAAARQVARDLLGEVEDRHALQPDMAGAGQARQEQALAAEQHVLEAAHHLNVERHASARTRRHGRRGRAAARRAPRSRSTSSPERSSQTTPGPVTFCRMKPVAAEEAGADAPLPGDLAA